MVWEFRRLEKIVLEIGRRDRLELLKDLVKARGEVEENVGEYVENIARELRFAGFERKMGFFGRRKIEIRKIVERGGAKDATFT